MHGRAHAPKRALGHPPCSRRARLATGARSRSASWRPPHSRRPFRSRRTRSQRPRGRPPYRLRLLRMPARLGGSGRWIIRVRSRTARRCSHRIHFEAFFQARVGAQFALHAIGHRELQVAAHAVFRERTSLFTSAPVGQNTVHMPHTEQRCASMRTLPNSRVSISGATEAPSESIASSTRMRRSGLNWGSVPASDMRNRSRKDGAPRRRS